MTVVLRRLFLVATPLALAVVLWWHPAGGEDIYEDVRDDVGAWLFVHTVFLFFIPLMGIAAYLLLNGLQGGAATVSRLALVSFLVFYTAYEVTVGLGTGVLVDYANGVPAAEQAAVADAIQEYNQNDILADPVSVSLIPRRLRMGGGDDRGRVAFRRAGAGWPVTLLLGFASLFAIHPPPVGPVGLFCFAAAAVLIERARARDARAPALSSATADATAGGTVS